MHFIFKKACKKEKKEMKCSHAGFGLGFERLIMYMTGVSNIRDVEAFPRTTGNAEF